MNFPRNWVFVLLAASFLSSSYGWAGVFSLPRFVNSGQWAAGVEPEVVFTDPASIGANVKFTQGVSDLINLTGIIGTGADPKGFRTGLNATFDFFPDVDRQPGLGIGVQGLYSRLSPTQGQFELTGIPYIHKAFVSGQSEFDPFIATPIGLVFSEGRYRATSLVSIGSSFQGSASVRYVIEVGVAVNNSNSYMSGGVVYYH